MRRRKFLGILGGAVAWPLPIHAQQAKPVIGFLSGRSAEELAFSSRRICNRTQRSRVCRGAQSLG